MGKEMFDHFKHELIFWNRIGVFPTENDTIETFKEKISYIASLLGSLDGFEKELHLLDSLYAIRPSWVQVIFSNENLRFWEAGCVWSEEDKEILSIQLRKGFEENESYLMLYNRGEVVMHECVHVVRSSLNSTIFDEFFAYFTSNSWNASFRSFFGPLYVSMYEVYTSLFISLSSTLLFLYVHFFDDSSIILRDELYYFLLFFIPFVIPVVALFRLLFRWRVFYRCKKKVSQFLEEIKSQINPLQFMIRLKDEEIKVFANIQSESIKDLIERKKSESLRWRQLSYFLE